VTRKGRTGPGDAAVAWLIVAALLLALLAGLCATAEVALMRVSASGLGELARGRKGELARGRKGKPARGRMGRRGHAPARLQAVLADPARYLAVLLLARVAGETAAIVLVAAALEHWLGSGWRTFLLVAVIMIAVLYLLAGIGPRALGRQHARAVALAAADVLYPVVRVLGPFPRLLLAVGSMITPGRGARDAFGSEEELRGLVDLLEQRRVIEPGARAMIHSVFELGDTIVREVMVPRTDIVFVERNKTVRQALSLALRSGFSRIPVVGENEDDVIGIAYLKDLVTSGQEHPGRESVEKVTSVMRPATFVPESKPVDELLKEMQQRRIHLAVVIDEYGGTAGLVTIEDLLEEIVGEITDEYDQEQPAVEWLAPDRARVTARLPVTDLEELFGTTIEAEDVETVGGLLAHAIGRVPIAGSTGTVAGLRLTADSLAGRRNRISTVTVERTGAPVQQPALRQDADG
jgi:CBS domain containing-hemolysin-like protein